MSGRIEHDDDAVLLWLVVCDLRASRRGVVEQFEQAGAAIGSITQVVHSDVQVHAHLLLASDCGQTGAGSSQDARRCRRNSGDQLSGEERHEVLP